MAYLLLATALFAFMIGAQIETIVIYANNFSRLRYFGRNSRFDVFSLAALALFLVGVVFAGRRIKANATPPSASAAELANRREFERRPSSRSSTERKRASISMSATAASDATAAIPEGDEGGDEVALAASVLDRAVAAHAAAAGTGSAADGVASSAAGEVCAESVAIRVEESAAAATASS